MRNAALLSVGTAAAQSFSVMAAPVLTRTYLPAEIGQLALFISFVSVANVALSLKFELGIVSTVSDREAAELTYCSILLSLPLSVFSGIMLYVAIRFSWFGYGSLPGYTALLMVTVLWLIGSFRSLRYWALRQCRFGLISRTTVGQHATRALAQVAFGFLGFGVGGLLLGELFGRAVGVVRMFQIGWSTVRGLLTNASNRELLATLHVHRKLVVFSLPSTFIATLVANLPLPVIVNLYGLEAGGSFALVQRVLSVPMGLIAASVADTFHERIATCAREDRENMPALLRRTSLWLLAIGLVPTLVLALSGRFLFQVIFGHKWGVAGTLATLSAPWFLTQFIVSPLSRLVFVLHGQELKLIYDVVILAAVVTVTILSAHKHLSLFTTMWAFSLVNAFAYIMYYLVLVWIVKKSQTATGHELTSE